MQRLSFSCEVADQTSNQVVPETLIGDQTRLKQVLINLVKNAFKFTRKGEIRIRAAFDQRESMLKFDVCDTGKGIKQEEMDQLFKQFGKLLRTAEMNSEGIGMGLMICRNLVRLNHGQITVQSDGEDRGSTFTFTFKV